ncbi:hypothetical protein BDF22DRAFT_743174 [Syncephalis plumigaleata]|nr:hypothetical protein BDF22DRAFT_743174 [Syncephalis plumigaleata]
MACVYTVHPSIFLGHSAHNPANVPLRTIAPPVQTNSVAAATFSRQTCCAEYLLDSIVSVVSKRLHQRLFNAIVSFFYCISGSYQQAALQDCCAEHFLSAILDPMNKVLYAGAPFKSNGTKTLVSRFHDTTTMPRNRVARPPRIAPPPIQRTLYSIEESPLESDSIQHSFNSVEALPLESDNDQHASMLPTTPEEELIFVIEDYTDKVASNPCKRPLENEADLATSCMPRTKKGRLQIPVSTCQWPRTRKRTVIRRRTQPSFKLPGLVLVCPPMDVDDDYMLNTPTTPNDAHLPIVSFSLAQGLPWMTTAKQDWTKQHTLSMLLFDLTKDTMLLDAY